MKKLCIALMMGLSLVVLDASAAIKKTTKCPTNATCGDGGKIISCKAGYYKESDKACKKCPAHATCDGIGIQHCDSGYYRESENAKSCKRCPAGYKCGDDSSTGIGTPHPCPARMYSKAGSTECQMCPAGTVSTIGSATCKKCPAGTFEKYGIACVPCSDDTYSAAGATVCKTCPKGKTSNANHTGCLVGKNLNNGSTSIKKPVNQATQPGRNCAIGLYLSSGKCKKCPSGYACNHDIATKCSAGSYARYGAQCELCTGDTYSAAGATSCKACPKGKKASADHTKCVKA